MGEGLRVLIEVLPSTSIPPNKKLMKVFYLWAVQDSNLSPQSRQDRALPDELTALYLSFNQQSIRYTIFILIANNKLIPICLYVFYIILY